MRRHRRTISRRGFTLIEAALATVIIGVGFVSMLQLYAACTMQNATATRSTAAMLLATNLRERLMDAPFAELAGMDGERFSPPIDAQGNPVDGMERYGQAIRVVPVYPDKLSANTAIANEIPAGTYTGAVRVTVAVTYGDSAEGPAVELYHLSWVRLDH